MRRMAAVAAAAAAALPVVRLSWNCGACGVVASEACACGTGTTPSAPAFAIHSADSAAAFVCLSSASAAGSSSLGDAGSAAADLAFLAAATFRAKSAGFSCSRRCSGLTRPDSPPPGSTGLAKGAEPMGGIMLLHVQMGFAGK